MLKVALVAGEMSGDILGAGLMSALKSHFPKVSFIGVGGPLMQAEGLESIFSMERLAVMGISEVLGRVPELLWRRYNLIKELVSVKPDVFIGIDAPDFNLNIEYALRKSGIKTVHYVSPSVWAWRQSRVKKIKRSCDLMLTLFPFEADFYKKENISVCFVGHPLADKISTHTNGDAAKIALGLEQSATVVALMPGSRKGEVARLGELFLDTAELLLSKKKDIQFVLPCANQKRRLQLENFLINRNLPVKLLDGRSHLALAACDAVLIASGTATLEALLINRPMVVAYKVSAITYSILKRLIKSKYISLPNLLAEKLLVSEFIQDAATPQALSNALFSVLELDGADIQTKSFGIIGDSLRCNASMRAANAIIELLSVEN